MIDCAFWLECLVLHGLFLSWRLDCFPPTYESRLEIVVDCHFFILCAITGFHNQLVNLYFVTVQNVHCAILNVYDADTRFVHAPLNWVGIYCACTVDDSVKWQCTLSYILELFLTVIQCSWVLYSFFHKHLITIHYPWTCWNLLKQSDLGKKAI